MCDISKNALANINVTVSFGGSRGGGRSRSASQRAGGFYSR